jgi:outer membrane protein
MKALVLLASLGVLTSSAPAFAQAAPAQQPAAQAPAAQQPRPATPPATQGTAPPAAPPAQVPFPAGSKYAYVNIQGIMQFSADGKAATAKLQGEQKKLQAEAEQRHKTMEASQQKLQTGGTLLSEAARAQLEKDIEKMQRDGERFEQDAQADLTEMQQKLQTEFNRKLFPVLEKMCKDLGLQMLFSAGDSGLIWAEPGLDLTMDAAKRMDTAPTPPPLPATAAPATPPAAPGAATPPKR